MKKLLLIIPLFWIGCSSDNTIAHQFMQHLNEGKIDDAKKFTGNHFEVKYNFGMRPPQGDFFEMMKEKQFMHPKFGPYDAETSGDKIIIYTRNSSDFTRYLDLPPADLKYNFFIENDKIQRIEIDSLPGFAKDDKIMMDKWRAFSDWLQKEKNVTDYDLQSSPEKRLEYAKEYYETKH